MKILLLLPDGRIHKVQLGSLTRSLREAPLTMTLLAALVPPDLGAELRLVDESIDTVPATETFDLVAISAMTGTSTRAYHWADHFRARGATVVPGGVHVPLRPVRPPLQHRVQDPFGGGFHPHVHCFQGDIRHTAPICWGGGRLLLLGFQGRLGTGEKGAEGGGVWGEIGHGLSLPVAPSMAWSGGKARALTLSWTSSHKGMVKRHGGARMGPPLNPSYFRAFVAGKKPSRTFHTASMSSFSPVKMICRLFLSFRALR